MGELLVRERLVDGFSWSPPGWTLQADTLRELVMVQDMVLQGSQLGRPGVFVYLSGGQLRPTDKAMAASSARTSSSAGAARLSDEEERLLTKRSIEWHRANTWETLF